MLVLKFRGLFRTVANVYCKAFLQKLNYFHKRAQQMFDIVLSTSQKLIYVHVIHSVNSVTLLSVYSLDICESINWVLYDWNIRF